MSRFLGAHRLRKRLRSMRLLEFLNAFLIPFVLIRLSSGSGAATEGWLLRGYALALVSYLLLQGALYWHLKLKVLSGERFPGWFVPLFRRFERSNRWLLLAYPVLLAGGIALGLSHIADVMWSLPPYVLALLEHVNYYAYQLSHQTRNDLRYLARHRRLRRSALFKDLERETRRRSARETVGR